MSAALLKTNAKAFNKGLDDFFEEVEQAAAAALRGLSIRAFKFILAETPQDYGTAVANWKYQVGTPDLSFDPNIFRINPGNDLLLNPPGGGGHNRGDSEAQEYALRQNAGRALPVTAYSNIYINNSVTQDGETYILDLEKGAILREPNRPGRMVARAVENFEIGGEISPTELQALKGETL